MHKKIMLACMALVAFAAFAVMPAVASASPELGETTFVEGSHIWDKVIAPKKVRAHLIEPSRMTDGGGGVLVECSEATMTGELTENSGTSIKGDITSAVFSNAGGAECSSTFGTTTRITTKIEDAGGVQTGVPWCLTSVPKTDNFEVRGGSCTEAARALKFIMDTSAFGECEYSKATSVTGTFRTDIKETEDAILTVTKSGPFTRTRGSFFCPAEGYLDMAFTLETDATSNTEPLYIR